MLNVSKCTKHTNAMSMSPIFRRDIYPVLFWSLSEPLDSWQALRPTIFPSVPRLLTRVHDRCRMALPGLFCAISMKIREYAVLQDASRCFKMLQHVSSAALAISNVFSLGWMCGAARKLYKVRTVRYDKSPSHSKSRLSCTGRGLGLAQIRGPVQIHGFHTDFTQISQYNVT